MIEWTNLPINTISHLRRRKTKVHRPDFQFSTNLKTRGQQEAKSLPLKAFKARSPAIGPTSHRLHAQTSDVRNIAGSFHSLNVLNVLNNFGALKFRKFARLPVSIFRGSLANLMNWKSFRDGIGRLLGRDFWLMAASLVSAHMQISANFCRVPSKKSAYRAWRGVYCLWEKNCIAVLDYSHHVSKWLRSR